MVLNSYCGNDTARYDCVHVKAIEKNGNRSGVTFLGADWVWRDIATTTQGCLIQGESLNTAGKIGLSGPVQFLCSEVWVILARFEVRLGGAFTVLILHSCEDKTEQTHLRGHRVVHFHVLHYAVHVAGVRKAPEVGEFGSIGCR